MSHLIRRTATAAAVATAALLSGTGIASAAPQLAFVNQLEFDPAVVTGQFAKKRGDLEINYSCDLPGIQREALLQLHTVGPGDGPVAQFAAICDGKTRTHRGIKAGSNTSMRVHLFDDGDIRGSISVRGIG
jgi:hypothetical protein